MSSKRSTIPVKPEVLQWAFETRGLPREEVKKKFDAKNVTLEEIERGEKDPTWAQLKKLAEIYKRSPLELLSKRPPNEPKPKDFDFRANKRKLIDPKTLLAIRRAHRIQTFFNNLDKLTDRPPYHSVSLNTKENLEKEAQRIRNSFFPSIEEQIHWENKKKDGLQALENWKKSIEKIGILVLEKSLKKNLEDISGLSLAGSPPVILLNYSDTPYRKIFTLFHEYAHILFRQKNPNALCSFDLANQKQRNEKEANRFSAEFLLPFSEIQKEKNFFNLKNVSDPNVLKETIKKASNRYKVSKDVILRRLRDFKKIPPATYDKENKILEDKHRESLKEEWWGRRNFPKEKFRENGLLFTKKVMSAYYSDEITFYNALVYLDIKSKYWNRIEEFVIEQE